MIAAYVLAKTYAAFSEGLFDEAEMICLNKKRYSK